MITQRVLDSPIGPLLLTAGGGRLKGVTLAPVDAPSPSFLVPDADRAVLALAETQLNEYFAGQRRQFELPLGPAGTAFQQRVWEELALIGYGQTLSYGQVAARIGQPGASRAVGRANGANPIPIVVPCHRVVASGMRLGGYSGGLDAKRWLLDLEAGAPVWS
ncbi:MAG: methylated-DNA--[protein]-cysteine S-methyltransferase [Acidimicrobiales bacterium]